MKTLKNKLIIADNVEGTNGFYFEKDVKEFITDRLDELETMLNQIKLINGAIGEVKEKEKIKLCKDLQKDIECNIRELKTGETK